MTSANGIHTRLNPNTIPKERFVQAISDMAEQVWDFHNRWGFGSGAFQHHRVSDIIRERSHILAEEVRELHEATEADATQDIIDEAADVLFVAIGHIEALGDTGIQGVQRVTRKNASKTQLTHAIRPDTGKLLPKQGKPHKWQ